LKESGYEETVLDALCARFQPQEFFITSFLFDSLVRVRALIPAVRIGVLVSEISRSQALERFRQTGADFLAPDYPMLDQHTVAEATRLHIPLLPWNVNQPDEIRRCLQEPSIFGVITDQPAQALRIRAVVSR
jgi:glycerophosphoryl diester phosphodiesterase